MLPSMADLRFQAPPSEASGPHIESVHSDDEVNEPGGDREDSVFISLSDRGKGLWGSPDHLCPVVAGGGGFPYNPATTRGR